MLVLALLGGAAFAGDVTVEVREGPEPRVSAGIACARGVVVV